MSRCAIRKMFSSKSSKLSILLFAALLFRCAQHIEAHSWVECTDYRMDNSDDEVNYKKEKCFGFPRCGANQATKKFGVDTGFDFRPKPDAAHQCQCSRNEQGTYGSKTPQATYKQGQTVCLAFPAKNHVGHKCANPHIKDQELQIRRTGVNPTADPSKTAWEKKYVHFTKDGKKNVGFMNCPNFCNEPDKALCTACFDVESDLTPGEYTFQWYWEFNVGEFFSTCFEVSVEADMGQGQTSPPEEPQPEEKEKEKVKASKASSGHTKSRSKKQTEVKPPAKETKAPEVEEKEELEYTKASMDMHEKENEPETQPAEKHNDSNDEYELECYER